MNGTSPGFKTRRLSVDLVETMLAGLSMFALAVFLAALRGRGLGLDAFGAFALAVLLPRFLVNLLNMGVAPANVYYVGRGDASVRQALKTSLKTWGVLSVLGVGIGSAVITWKAATLLPGVPPLILWIALATYPILLLRAFLVSLLQAVRDFRWYNRVQIFDLGAVLLLTCVAILVFDLGIVGALAAYGLGVALGLPLCLVRLRPHLARQSENPPLDHFAKRSFQYGWKSHLANLLAFINYRGDVFLINLFLNQAATGAYVAALVISEKLWMLSQAAGTVIFPRLAALRADPVSRNHLTALVSRWVFAITLVAAAGLAVSARLLIALLFGSEYAEAVTALLWLLPGTVLVSFGRVLANDIAARGRVDLNVCSAAVLVVVNISLNLILIPRWGISGAAIASTVGWAVHSAITLGFYSALSGTRWWVPLVWNRSDWQRLPQIAASLREVFASAFGSNPFKASHETRTPEET